MSVLALGSALELRTKNILSEASIEELSLVAQFGSFPLSAPFGSLQKVQAIVTPLCERHSIPEPLIVIHPNLPWKAAMMDRSQGRDILLLTEELLTTLNDRELRAVIAHELAHQNRWFSRLSEGTSVLTEWTKPIVRWGMLLLGFSILAPITGILPACPLAIAASLETTRAARKIMDLCRFYVSRQNEIKTDLRACAMTGDPEALIVALTKLDTCPPEILEKREKLARRGLITHPRLEERTKEIRRVFGSPS
jgi:heat shock protein HtpX